MSPEVLVCDDQVRAAQRVEVPPQELLDQVVESVRNDSRQGTASFLAETVVPHGGE